MGRTSSQINPRTSCSQLSLQREEPLIGSAPKVEIWFLLSYRGPMGAKAFEESNIPSSVKDHLSAQLESIPHSRLLLVRPHPQKDDDVTLHIVIGRELDPFYYSFKLKRYEDVLALDVPMILDDNPMHSYRIGHRPFYVVCTNGNRDPCCAKYGRPAYEALKQLASQRVWQGSHVSGHRFAANVVVFPHGIYYGRVAPSDAHALLKAGDRGELRLENYRGRACHDPAVQAAEALLRQRTGRKNLDAFQVLDSAQMEPETWSVRFLGTRNELVHRIVLKSRVSEEQDLVSCRSGKKASVVRYDLLSYGIED